MNKYIILLQSVFIRIRCRFRHALILPCLLIAIIESASAINLDALKKAGVEELVVIARNRIACSHTYTYFNEGFKAGGGLYLASKDGMKLLVDAADGQILDAELSYDAKTILFSWKKSEHMGYDLFLINIDGSGLRQLTNHPANDFNASWLPDGGITFLSDRDNNYAYCHSSSSAVLYRMQPDGTKLKRLSANYLSDITPHVMNDGKIMYTRWEYVDRFQIPSQGLWAQNPDGTSLKHIYGGRMLEPVTIMEAKSIPGTQKLLTILTGHNKGICGGIGVVDPSVGGNSMESLTVIMGEMVTFDLQNRRNENQQYEYPYPVNEEWFLVSNGGNIQLCSYDGKQVENVLTKGEGLGKNKFGFFGALPVQKREREPIIGSSLPENAPPLAKVIMQDVYIGLEDQLADGSLKRGDVAQIRVVNCMGKHDIGEKKRSAFCFQFPVVSAGTTMEPKKTISTVEIETDGSAMFEVPAMEPVILQAVDADGRVIQRMRTFSQFMPGEVQSCTGCHKDRNKSAPPLKGSRIIALQKKVQKLNGAPWKENDLGFSYIEQVQPILDRHCIQCHNVRENAAGLDLSGDRTDLFNVSYDNLVRDGLNKAPNIHKPKEHLMRGIPEEEWFPNKYISYIPSHNGMEKVYMDESYFLPKSWGSYKSPIADLIRNGHPDASGTLRAQLSDLEKRTIYAWIDYNVPYYATSHANHPELPHGMRELVPEKYDSLLTDVTQRRCISCHNKQHNVTGWFSWYDSKSGKGKNKPRHLPLKHYLRWEKPELNNFMLAPLAKSAGGTEQCGKPVFKDKNDTDYLKLFHAFDSIHERVNKVPRMDMPGAKEVRGENHLKLYQCKEKP